MSVSSPRPRPDEQRDSSQSEHDEEYSEQSEEEIIDNHDDHQRVVQPLTPEALAAFNAAQEKAGIIYISRIPPGMRPTKVRHLMSAYGEIGRVYLQQEGAIYIKYIYGSQGFYLIALRSEKSVFATETHLYEKSPLHRRVGGVQG